MTRATSKPIEDYGLIGDGRTIALVAKDGAIDWLCWPRFDSDACLCALLGTGENGTWRIAPAGAATATRRYAGDDLVLRTTFEADGGRLVLMTDPVLRFDSERPLGDRFRPPLRYPDTGLLAHWGLRLDDGINSETTPTDLGRGIKVDAAGFGSFTRTGGNCTLSPSRAVARCRIGKGYATLVADADFALSPEAGPRAAVLQLLGELAR